MFGVGHVPELIVIAVIVILLFGGKKIAGLGKGVGDAIREVRSASKSADADDDKKPDHQTA